MERSIKDGAVEAYFHKDSKLVEGPNTTKVTGK